MKKIISYFIVSVIFFNLLFIFYYYFRIVNFFYLDLFGDNRLINAITINLIVLIVNITLVLLYRYFKLNGISYLGSIILGMIIGVISSIASLRTNEYEVGDYLAIVSFFIINTVFIFYSLNFDIEKIRVFK